MIVVSLTTNSHRPTVVTTPIVKYSNDSLYETKYSDSKYFVSVETGIAVFYCIGVLTYCGQDTGILRTHVVATVESQLLH